VEGKKAGEGGRVGSRRRSYSYVSKKKKVDVRQIEEQPKGCKDYCGKGR